jgi:hypothetical protein
MDPSSIHHGFIMDINWKQLAYNLRNLQTGLLDNTSCEVSVRGLTEETLRSFYVLWEEFLVLSKPFFFQKSP